MNNTKPIDAAAAETSTVKPSEHIDLRIGGMTCPHCPPAIEKALAAVPGVTSAHVNLASNIARISYEPSRTKLADIVQAIRSIGYVPGTATLRIPIKNMHCSSCSMLIEFALQMTPGIVHARASLGPNAADVEYDPEKVDFDGIRQAIEQAGYHVAEPKLKDQTDLLDPAEAALQEEYRTLMRKFWFAAVIYHSGHRLQLPGPNPWLARLDANGERDAPRCLGAARPAQLSGDGLVRLAILQRHVECAQASRRQHAHPDRDRHYRGLRLFRGGRRLAGDFS